MSKSWAGGSTRTWRTIRARVLHRDGHTCQIRTPGICTTTATHVHHTLGRHITGDNPDYLVASCRACNLHIGDPTRPKQSDPKPGRYTQW